MSARAFLGATFRFFGQVVATALVVVILLGLFETRGSNAQGDPDPCADGFAQYSIDADADGLRR